MAEYKPPRDSTLDKRVQRGIELLDERLPGWRKRVQTEGDAFVLRDGRGFEILLDVDMGCCDACLLARLLHEDFDDAIRLLGLTEAQADQHGFSMNVPEDFSSDSSEYDAAYRSLERAWLRALS